MNTKQKTDPVEHLENHIKTIHDESGKHVQSIFRKYPITLSLLITFGLVSILHGFEKVFDKIQYFNENPLVLILIGVGMLVGTGSIYKVLDNHR